MSPSISNSPLHTIFDNEAFSPHIEYSFNLIASILGVNLTSSSYQDFFARLNSGQTVPALLIAYGKQFPSPSIKCPIIWIHPSGFFSTKDFLTPVQLPAVCLKKINGKSFPILYPGARQQLFVNKRDNLIETNIDLIAGIFFLVSRLEEYIIKDRDEHSRFSASSSVLFENNWLARPLANEYIAVLGQWIKELQPKIAFLPAWPHGQAALLLSYDVDILGKYTGLHGLKRLASSILQHPTPARAGRELIDYLLIKTGLRRDPYWCFAEIINHETQQKLSSAFFLLSEDFKLANKRLNLLLDLLKSSEREIGLHISYHGFNNYQKIKEEKRNLEELTGYNVVGCRSHYLRLEVPASWQLLEQAGFQYDSSLGFADYPGFRAGLCHPFRPFDLLQKRHLRLWEIPLIIMDVSLYDYLGLSAEAGLERIKLLAQEIAKYNGLLVILWHNFSFDATQRPGWQKTYQNSLEFFSSCSLSSLTGREIINHWEERLQVLSSD